MKSAAKILKIWQIANINVNISSVCIAFLGGVCSYSWVLTSLFQIKSFFFM